MLDVYFMAILSNALPSHFSGILMAMNTKLYTSVVDIQTGTLYGKWELILVSWVSGKRSSGQMGHSTGSFIGQTIVMGKGEPRLVNGSWAKGAVVGQVVVLGLRSDRQFFSPWIQNWILVIEGRATTLSSLLDLKHSNLPSWNCQLILKKQNQWNLNQ